MNMTTVPQTLLVIGAGAIGLELGSVWCRLGAEVTLVEVLDHIGSELADKEVAAEYQKILEHQGLKFVLGAKVTGVDANQSGAVVHVQTGERDYRDMHAEKVLVAVGRKPVTSGLDLAKVGVEVDRRGAIVVNDVCQTTAPGIFAAGDCTPGPQVAHKSTLEAAAVVEHLFAGKKMDLAYRFLPSVIYTQPELAWTGSTEEVLRKEGVKVKSRKAHMFLNMRETYAPELSGVAKIVYEEGSERVLGACYVSTTAGDLVAEAVLAAKVGAKLDMVGNVPHAHPFFKSLHTLMDLDME